MTDLHDSTQPLVEGISARQRWIAVLARSNRNELQGYWDQLPQAPEFNHIRQPETGLVMVRARAGGSGQRFNLGEVTVTRCSVRLNDGTVGHGYVTGRDHQHAKLAAVFDALLQLDDWEAELDASVISKIEHRLQTERQEREEKVASTKVDFYTMVRGEDQ